jgi:UDP-N-acetylmuramoyl-tripeptide--D-alanyl-D-alanine ligase
LCKFYRFKFNIAVIGITGSEGKTSTKDMLALVLNKKFNVCKTLTNKNDLSGTIETTLNIKNLS